MFISGAVAQNSGDYRWVNTTANAHLSVAGNWEMYDGTGWFAAAAIPGSNAVIRSPEGSSHANLRINVDDWTIGGINVVLTNMWRLQATGTAKTMTVTGDLIKAGRQIFAFINGDALLTVNILGNLDVQEHFLNVGTSVAALNSFSVAGHTTIAGSLRSRGNTVLNTVALNNGSMTVWESNNAGTTGGVTVAGISGTGSIQSKSDAKGITQDIINAGSLLINGASGSFNFSGTLRDGMAPDGASTFSLVKEGGSTQTFSGTGTYSGTTVVKAGTLIIDGEFSSVTNLISVESGAVFGGNGVLGAPVSFAAGAQLAFSTKPLTAAAFTFKNFSATDVAGIHSGVKDGTYKLLAGKINAANIKNVGKSNAVDINGRSVYFEVNGSALNLIVGSGKSASTGIALAVKGKPAPAPFDGWRIEAFGSIAGKENGSAVIQYESPEHEPVRLTPPKPVEIPAAAVRITAWFAIESGDAYLRFLVKDAAGKIHTVAVTDSHIDGPAINNTPARRNEWSLWNMAESTSLYMPTEAELRERLPKKNCDEVLAKLWPKPLTLAGIEIVPNKPGDRWGGLYDSPRKTAMQNGTGTFRLKFPQWKTQFPRDASFYAYLSDRYRSVQNEPLFFFPDDFTALNKTDIRWQLEIRAGYNGGIVWSATGNSTVNRTAPETLFDQKIVLPELPVGKYVVDSKVWNSAGEFDGMRRFTVYVGESSAGMPAAVAPEFALTTGRAREVFPAGTGTGNLKLVCNRTDVNSAGFFQISVVDYTGTEIVSNSFPAAAGEILIPVPLTEGSDYFAEAEYRVDGKVMDQSICHFGAAGILETAPQGDVPDSIPGRDDFLSGHAYVMTEYQQATHVSAVYPYTQTFNFDDFSEWAGRMSELGDQGIFAVKAGWANIEPLPGVFRWGIFDKEMEILAAQNAKIFFSYTPTSGGLWVPRWMNDSPFRNQFGDFKIKTGLVHPLSPAVKNGWHNYLRQLLCRYRAMPEFYGLTLYNTPFSAAVLPEPFVTDYSHTAQEEFNKWLIAQGRAPAKLTPLLVVPGMKTEDQGPDLSAGWRDFIEFCSYTTYENTREVLELIRSIDSRRIILFDRKSNSYAVEKTIPLLKQYNAIMKNEGSPGFREGMLRSMAIQNGVPFVEELHRHVPTSRSITDASNYFASYLGYGSVWLLRSTAESMHPDYYNPVHALFHTNYPFLKETQPRWNDYLRGEFYSPEVLVVGCRTDALVNGERRGVFDDIAGKQVYSALFEWAQVPAHFADEYCDWVDFSKFKLIFAEGEIMPQALIDKITAAAEAGIKTVVVGDAGHIAAESVNSTGVLKKALRGISNVKYIDPPARITASTSWDSPVGWNVSIVNEWLNWAGVERPVFVTADSQPGFQVQHRTANDGTVYLAVFRNYYGWYRNNIEFEEELLEKYGQVAGTVKLPVADGGIWIVEKLHRDEKLIGEFTAKNGAIEFSIDPAVAGEVQLIRVQKK
ncbi:MAG: beta-galactosidase [Kiritimatiellales bacterium]